MGVRPGGSESMVEMSRSPKSVMPKYPWYFREGFQVYRRVSERAADLGGLDPETAYAISALLAGRNADAPTE